LLAITESGSFCVCVAQLNFGIVVKEVLLSLTIAYYTDLLESGELTMKLEALAIAITLLIAIIAVMHSTINTGQKINIATISSSGSFQYINLVNESSNLISESFHLLVNEQLTLTCQRYFIENGIFSADEEAAACDIWMGHFDSLHRATELHTLNPKIICLLYRNIRTVWNPNNSVEYDSAQLQLFIDNDWILRDAAGDFVVDEEGSGYLVDVGNPAYQSWLAQWLKTYISRYGANGAFLDNCLASDEITWGTTQVPINPRTGVAWINQEWNNGVISTVNTVKAVLGDKMYVVGNGVWNGASWNNRLQYYQSLLLNANIDGIMSEGWISDYAKPLWYDETTWKKSVDMAVWINNNFLSKGQKLFVAVSYNAADGTVPSGCTLEQYALFSYASILLATVNSGNSLSYGSYMVNNYLQSLFRINIGTPINTYSIIPNTNVYTRDFTNVKVLVNPTDTAFNVNLNKQYLRDNILVSALTVQPHTGIILKTK
jgi:hypothetical protein